MRWSRGRSSWPSHASATSVFRRRNGRQMILTDGDQPAGPAPERDANQTLIEAIAKAHRWQEQIEAGQYAGIEDLAKAVGVDRTYAGRVLPQVRQLLL
jgi:hypothetical protein